jgi:hypothetical protein
VHKKVVVVVVVAEKFVRLTQSSVSTRVFEFPIKGPAADTTSHMVVTLVKKYTMLSFV